MLSDLRYVVRALWRTPGFTGVAILTLALGVGSAAAIFSVVDWILFASSPFPPELVMVGSTEKQGAFIPVQFDAPAQAYRAALAEVSVGQALSSFRTGNVVLEGEPIATGHAGVSVNFFDLLGIAPTLGRGFAAGEDTRGRDDVVVLSDLFWRQHFAADPRVLGRKLIVGDTVCTVVGVLPANAPMPVYFGGYLFRPLTYRADPAIPWDPILFMLARLRPGVTIAQAEQALGAAKLDVTPVMRAQMGERRATLLPVSQLKKLFRPEVYWLLVGAVAFLYAIACLNGANLLLVRMLGRQRELSIRLALGCGRRRLLRLLLLESLVITGAAAIVGALLANWLAPLFGALAWGDGTIELAHWSLGTRPILLLAALTVLTGGLIAIVPALRAWRSSVSGGLKDGAGALGESRRLAQLRGVLVVAQATFAVILLTGAGLMVRTFDRLQSVSLGFAENDRIKLQLVFPPRYAAGNEERLALLKKLQEHLRRVPGVRAVAYGTDPLLPGGNFGGTQIALPDGRTISATVDHFSSEYLQTAGIRVKRGRMVHATGAEVMINDSLARARYPGQDPIGQYLKPLNSQSPEKGWEVVGVFNDVRENVRSAPGFRIVAPETWRPPAMSTFLIETAPAAGAPLIGAIKRAVFEFDRQIVPFDVVAVRELRGRLMSYERFVGLVLKVLSGFALLLTVVGVFSVIAYSVDRRMNEFGVRLALGATSRDLVRLVVGRGVLLVIGGVALGLAASVALARYLQSLLFETPPHDPVVLSSVALLLVAAAAAACLMPARRALRADVAKLLRAE